MNRFPWKKAAWITVVLAAVAIGGWYCFHRILKPRSLPEGFIQANGRMEAESYSASAKIAGKVIRVMADEGDFVQAGAVVAVLDDSPVRERVQQAASALASAKARLEAAQSAYRLLEKELPLAVERAKAARDHAEALLVKAEAAERQAERDADRYRRLADEGSIGRQKSEHALLALASARSDRRSAQSGLMQAQKMLEDALLGPSRLRAKADEIRSIEATVGQAKAALAEVRSIEADLTIRAPVSGVVTVKSVNVGEIAAAGAPLFWMINLDELYLKAYVPEKEIGKLRRGLPARIYIDSLPDTPFEGKITFIASRAEFTPKEVQTPDERVKLVYAVKITVDQNPDHRLTPGIPADAVIRWKDGSEWVKPLW